MMQIHFKGTNDISKAERIYNGITGNKPRTDTPKTSLGRITEALNNANNLNDR